MLQLFFKSDNTRTMSLEQKMLEPEFYWRLSKDISKLKLQPRVYQNFLQLLLAKLQSEPVASSGLGVKKLALNALQNNWLLPQDYKYRNVLQQFCQLLCCLHTEVCKPQLCDYCCRNVDFLLDNRAAIKNLVYATVAKNAQQHTWHKRIVTLIVITAVNLPCGLLALAVLIMLREPQKYAFTRKWFGQTVPLCQFTHQAEVFNAQMNALELQIQQAKTDKHDLCTHITTLQQQQVMLKQNLAASIKQLQQLLQQLCGNAQMLLPQVQNSQAQVAALQQQLTTLNAKLLSLEYSVG
jgi:hypothetical protein